MFHPSESHSAPRLPAENQETSPRPPVVFRHSAPGAVRRRRHRRAADSPSLIRREEDGRVPHAQQILHVVRAVDPRDSGACRVACIVHGGSMPADPDPLQRQTLALLFPVFGGHEMINNGRVSRARVTSRRDAAC